MIRKVLACLGVLSVLTMALLSTPQAAYAYGGPGSIVSGFGALLALVAAVGAAMFGFVWYPLKKVVRLLRGRTRDEGVDTA